MKQRVYIAGPMTGLPDFNYPAFHEAAAKLRAMGYEVVNPAENDRDTNDPWEVFLREALQKMLTCDAVALLQGWALSRGARLEVHVANAIGMRVAFMHEILAT